MFVVRGKSGVTFNSCEIGRVNREESYETREAAEKALEQLKAAEFYVVENPLQFDLTSEQYDLFIRVHNSHMKSMGTSNQEKYALENVKNVIWDSGDSCLKVYFEDAWWHYDRNGTWY